MFTEAQEVESQKHQPHAIMRLQTGEKEDDGAAGDDGETYQARLFVADEEMAAICSRVIARARLGEPKPMNIPGVDNSVSSIWAPDDQDKENKFFICNWTSHGPVNSQNEYKPAFTHQSYCYFKVLTSSHFDMILCPPNCPIEFYNKGAIQPYISMDTYANYVSSGARCTDRNVGVDGKYFYFIGNSHDLHRVDMSVYLKSEKIHEKVADFYHRRKSSDSRTNEMVILQSNGTLLINESSVDLQDEALKKENPVFHTIRELPHFLVVSGVKKKEKNSSQLIFLRLYDSSNYFFRDELLPPVDESNQVYQTILPVYARKVPLLICSRYFKVVDLVGLHTRKKRLTLIEAKKVCNGEILCWYALNPNELLFGVDSSTGLMSISLEF